MGKFWQLLELYCPKHSNLKIHYHRLRFSRHFFYILFLTSAFSLLLGCAVKRDTIGTVVDYSPSTQNSNHKSFYSIGNAGSYQKGPNERLFNAFTSFLKQESKEDDYLLFLGDNVHDNNIDKLPNRNQLDIQLKLTKSFKGTTVFTQGELDWNSTGIKGLEKIETYIEEYLGEEDHFLPKNGCPLEVIDVSDDIELIIINSQWYIEDWNKIKGMNDKCELKTRDQFKALLTSEIRKAAHKTVLIAMHHPLYTNGIYGSEIPSDALYRPTAENVFIPFAGVLWSFLRVQGGLSKQDRYNPLMNELMADVETAAFQAERVIVLSAHERSSQYIDHPNLKQIISGMGSDAKYARLGKDGIFTSTRPGFTETRLYEDGSSSVHFHTLTDEDTFETRFETKAFDTPKEYNIDSLTEQFPKTVLASVYPKELVDVDAKYEKFWGKHYRYVYGVEVNAPVAVLDTLYGGLKVERAGGGNQTLSLRLVDKNDKEYNMRAIAKDPIAFLKSSGYTDLDGEVYFDKTVPASLIKDFYTAAHPYGAFAIPELAKAIDVNHTRPKLYYVPKQKALGNFNDIHGDMLYMIVEKPDEDFSSSAMFSYSKEVESTPDLFKELREDEKNKLDERLYIRSRIFDMLLGDWDRHEDQWRWAQDQKDTEDEIVNYLAVPRDRDQVFANFDGKFIETIQKVLSGTRELGKYGPDIEYIEQFSESAINLDRALVYHADEVVWQEEVRYIQEHITEEVVRKAFSEAPIEIQDEVWQGIQKDLLSRKQHLPDIVSRYYSHFAKFQVLKTTDKDDHIFVENTPAGDVRVHAYRIKDGALGVQLFDRTYDHTETENLWIYGLDDKDVFEVNGTFKSAIQVVLAGGLQNDTYTIEGGKNVTVYDQKSYKNTLTSKGKATFHLDDIYENHIYDSERRPGGAGGFGLDLPYNPDTGFSPHITFAKGSMGFERNPFTTQLVLDAQYFSLTQAADVSLAWHRSHLFQDWNFKITGRATTANFTQNYFGIGNNSENEEATFDTNRIFVQQFSSGLGIYYNGEYGTAAAIDLQYERGDVRNLFNPAPVFADTEYLNLTGVYRYHSIDDERFTTRGMDFKLEGNYADELTSADFVGAIDPSLTLWNAIDRSRDLVLKTTFAGKLRFGDDIPFYRLASIGADAGLRSYRQDRFQGQQALTASADLRYQFKPLKTAFFPLRIQAFAGYDTGRVWITEEKSNTLHYSYGGGFQITTAAVFKARASYFTGPEGGRLAFGVSVGL